MTPVILDSFDYKNTLDTINKDSVYELYGYSMGASSISHFMRINKLHRPRYIITVGAYHTTDVNFSKYEVKFDNYFDASGEKNTSPGKHLKISHDKIMRYVTDNFY